MGTIVYGRRTLPEADIIATLALIAKGSRGTSLLRVKGYKEDTILDWLRAAAKQAETEIKRQFWRPTMLDINPTVVAQ